MRGLTLEEYAPYHRQVLHTLSMLAQSIKGVRTHSAGPEYTSLMSSFLMHNVSGARSLLALYESSGVEWFPVSVGYGIARTMFEVDVTAHYISQSPQERACQYILFEHILNKQKMDVCNKHRKSTDPLWREAMEVEWQAKWLEREQEVNEKFAEFAPLFTSRGKKTRLFQNWSGKKISDLASEVGHKEAYDTFYKDLSSYTHVDVNAVNRYLHLSPDGLSWTQRANEYDVGEILHDAASFLTCYLRHFGSQFSVLDAASVDSCWDAEGVWSRKSFVSEPHIQ